MRIQISEVVSAKDWWYMSCRDRWGKKSSPKATHINVLEAPLLSLSQGTIVKGNECFTGFEWIALSPFITRVATLQVQDGLKGN